MYQPASSSIQPQTCAYHDSTCMRARLEGYAYCVRHILEDKNAPFKQCNYVYSNNGRRCIMPAPKTEKRDSGFCTEHTRMAQLIRQRSSRRHLPPPTAESHLLSLAHYATPDNRAPSEDVPGLGDTADEEDSASGKESEEFIDVVTPALNPFVEIDAAKVNNDMCRILDYASESDSDVEPATFSGTWRGMDMDSSDAESLDGCSLEEPCKNVAFRQAGVYTAEEVAQITGDKMIRLQSLYIDQFRRLQVVLKERRRKYLHALKKEKETYCSIHNQSRDTVKEQKLYDKLKALKRYKKLSGVEAILHKKNLERRAMATEGVTVRQPPTTKCIFTEGGVRCGEKTLPVAKHCYKHILLDSHQVLFRICGCTIAGFPCREPVPVVFENATCVYHSRLPPAPPHLSAIHAKAEDDAREQSESQSVEVPRIDPDQSKPSSPIKEEAMEGDPSESFNSESSATDTASTIESPEHVDDC